MEPLSSQVDRNRKAVVTYRPATKNAPLTQRYAYLRRRGYLLQSGRARPARTTPTIERALADLCRGRTQETATCPIKSRGCDYALQPKTPIYFYLSDPKVSQTLYLDAITRAVDDNQCGAVSS